MPKVDVTKADRVRLSGRVTGITAGAVDNLSLAGAQLEIYAVGKNSERLGAALTSQKIAANGTNSGNWSGIDVASNQPLEFVITADGYAPRIFIAARFTARLASCSYGAERIADADTKDANAKAIVNFFRPRGYFDLARDTMRLDGKPALGLPPSGAGLAVSKIKLPSDESRAITGEWSNGLSTERVTGRTWPATGGNNGGHTVTLELTY